MQNEKTEDRSRVVLAAILIVVGLLWLFRQLGVHFHFDELFAPFHWIYHKIGNVIFSWPMILVLVGLILLAGKRSGGVALIVVGGIFLIPRIFLLPGFSFSLIFPVLLVVAGIAMVANKV
ncbi:MAG TPA: hypothetical protein PK167_06895 [Prolixibacteraceae bacterium]|nr:hypothetical protein [Prolixibacteraceae bacterium]